VGPLRPNEAETRRRLAEHSGGRAVGPDLADHVALAVLHPALAVKFAQGATEAGVLGLRYAQPSGERPGLDGLVGAFGGRVQDRVFKIRHRASIRARSSVGSLAA